MYVFACASKPNEHNITYTLFRPSGWLHLGRWCWGLSPRKVSHTVALVNSVSTWFHASVQASWAQFSCRPLLLRTDWMSSSHRFLGRACLRLQPRHSGVQPATQCAQRSLNIVATVACPLPFSLYGCFQPALQTEIFQMVFRLAGGSTQPVYPRFYIVIICATPAAPNDHSQHLALRSSDPW